MDEPIGDPRQTFQLNLGLHEDELLALKKTAKEDGIATAGQAIRWIRAYLRDRGHKLSERRFMTRRDDGPND
jgi:hypothetical protein